MFELDFNKATVWLLPTFMRNSFWVNFCIALVNPFVKIYNAFYSKRGDTIYKLNHNSQICYLESALNDTFDPVDRRIYIQDAGGEVVIIINRDTDEPPYLILDDDHTETLLHKDSSYDGGTYDFLVITPVKYSTSEIYRMKALINFYKLAGKRYDII